MWWHWRHRFRSIATKTAPRDEMAVLLCQNGTRKYCQFNGIAYISSLFPIFTQNPRLGKTIMALTSRRWCWDEAPEVQQASGLTLSSRLQSIYSAMTERHRPVDIKQTLVEAKVSYETTRAVILLNWNLHRPLILELIWAFHSKSKLQVPCCIQTSAEQQGIMVPLQHREH